MIKLDIEDADFKKNMQYLQKNAPNALSRVLNKTASDLRVKLKEDTRADYVIKVSSFNKATRINKASGTKLVAVLRGSGSVNELMNFRISQPRYDPKNRPKVHTAKVLKSSSMKKLQMGNNKAFVTRFRSGHIAIVQRVPGKRMKSNPQKTFIKKLLAPSIPKMIGSEINLYYQNKDFMRASLNKYVQEELRLLSGGRG